MSWTRGQLWHARLLSLRSRNEDGGNMVEYMLLLVLIAVLLIAVVTQIGHQVSTRFSSASSAMP
jgi:Flp pilus assembly pilin Flp